MAVGDIVTSVIQMTGYNAYFQPAATVEIMLTAVGGGTTIGYTNYNGTVGASTSLFTATNVFNTKIGITNSIYGKFYSEDGGGTGYVFYTGIQIG